jgi:PAS domain S-box-containing protein
MEKQKVLIVEDEGIIAADIQNTLKNLGYEVCGVVDSGERAVKFAGEKHPDLILMDILLRGEIDGIDAAKDILERYRIPVVYLSAHEDDKTIERTKDTHPYGFVLKPFSERDLKATLKMALFKHDAERRLLESEERYFRLTENARDIIFRISLPDGKYEYVNRASIDILGYTPEEFYSEPLLISKIIHPDWKHYFKVNWDRLLEGDVPPIYEFQVIQKSGEIRWLNQRNVLVTDKNNKPIALEGIVTDVTEQKKAEALIRKQQEEYRLIFDSVPAMIWYKDDKNKMLRVNKLAASIKGSTVEQMEGKYTEEFYPDEAADYLKDDLDVVCSGKPKLGIVERHETGTGKKIWVSTDKLPYRNEKGEVTGVLVFALDISRQKEIEEQLLRAEHRNALILNTIPDLLFQFDREGRFLDYKVREDNELFIKPSEFLNKKIEEVLPEEIASKAKYYIDKVLETRKPQLFEYEIMHDGTKHVYEARFAISGENEVLAIVRNITDRAAALNALKESEEKYRRLTNNAPVALTRLPINQQNYEFVNDEFVKQSGYTLEEFNSLTDQEVRELVHPEDRERVYKVYDQWAKSGFKGVNHIIYRIKNKSKKTKWLDSYHYADFDSRGKMVAINQIYIDITEQKKVEESLRLSEKKFRAVTDIAPITIYMLQGTKFIYGNKYAEVLTGYKNDELLDKNFWEIIHPDDREKAKKIAEARQKGEDAPSSYELRMITKQGKRKHVQINAALFEYEGKPAILGTALDISERKEAENALKESEEMFRAVAESMPAEIIVYQGDRFVYANPFAVTLTGYSIEELMKMNFWENTHPEYREIAKERGHMRMKGEKVPDRYELKILTKGGAEKWVDYSATVIHYKSKPAVLGTAIDITASKYAEEALKKSDERYKAFIQQSSEGIYRIELDLQIPVNLIKEQQFELYFKNAYIAECNETMAKMYGFNKIEDLIGRKVDELLVKDDPHNVEYMYDFIRNGYKILDYESHEIDKEGKPVYFLNNAVGIVEDGKLVRVWGTQRDITEMKKTEEMLKVSVFEKEILIKEIHHRVKNNLQIITSLLKLQASYVKDKKALELFEESQNRVQSMSLVHQKLYQSKDLGRINFGEYAKTLVSNLSQSLGVNAKSIKVNVDTDNVYLTLDTAIPGGLIINELLTNSVKHAFNDRENGLVWVRIKQNENSGSIEIEDNGIGLPKNFDLKNSSSFGLKLVSTLIEQIKGELKIESNNGTIIKVTFSTEEKPADS